ncbi:MAG TPA: hypothetical protein VGD10_02950 [Allosphingosinicella sp.]|uniref:hypothetical protein n=1 Tax=Allosphingosinicella sp. TaxID=2823234 RepID=UPI002EDB6C34
MSLKKLAGIVSAIALVTSGPALAQASAPSSETSRAAASLSPSQALNDRGDGIGWAMAGLVFAGVAYVLLSIVLDDDDDEESESP